MIAFLLWVIALALTIHFELWILFWILMIPTIIFCVIFVFGMITLLVGLIASIFDW